MRWAWLAGLALVGAPVAQAQSGCALVEKILAESSAGYGAILGERIDGKWYDSSLYLTGADECSIGLAENSSVFECAWAEETEAAANTRLTGLETVARSCLVDWDKVSIAGEPSFSGLKINRGYSYEGEDADSSVEVYHETYDDGTETVVWFRVYGPPPPKPASVSAAAPAPAAQAVPGPADVTSPTPAEISRVPKLEGLDLRYLAHSLWPRDTSTLDTVEFIDMSNVQRIGSRGYVWVLTTRSSPLVGAWAHYTLREVACGTTPQMRYIHSVHLGQNYLPNGTSVVNTSSKFEPGARADVQTVIDIACNGKRLAGPSYATPAEAAANREKAARGG